MAMHGSYFCHQNLVSNAGFSSKHPQELLQILHTIAIVVTLFFHTKKMCKCFKHNGNYTSLEGNC